MLKKYWGKIRLIFILIIGIGLLIYPLIKTDDVKIYINESLGFNRFSVLSDKHQMTLYDRKYNKIIDRDIKVSYEYKRKLYLYGPVFQGVIERDTDKLKIFLDNKEIGTRLDLNNIEDIQLVDKKNMNKNNMYIFNSLMNAEKINNRDKPKEMVIKLY